MYLFFHALLFFAGCGVVAHAFRQDGELLTEFDARLARGLDDHPTQPGDLVTQAPEVWLPLMMIGGGFLLLWGAIGLLPAVLRALGVGLTLIGQCAAAVLRSTAFHIALCCMLFYLGQVAFTGMMVHQIYDEHIESAARQLGVQFDERPDLNEQIRRFRELIRDIEQI